MISSSSPLLASYNPERITQSDKDRESLKNLSAIYKEGLFCIDVDSIGNVPKPYREGISSSCWRFARGISGSDVSHIAELINRIYMSYALKTQNYSLLLKEALQGMKWLKTHYALKGRKEVEDNLKRIICKAERVLEQLLIIEKEEGPLSKKEKDLPLNHFFYYQKKLEFFLKIHSLESNEIEFLKNCQIALNLGITLINEEFFLKKDSVEILKDSLTSSKFGILLPLNCQDQSSEMNEIISIGIRQTEKGLFVTYLDTHPEGSKEISLPNLLSLMKETLLTPSQIQVRATYGPYSHEEIIDLLHLHYFLFKQRLTAQNKEEALKNFKTLFDPRKRLPASALETLSFKNSSSSRSAILDWLLDTCQRNGQFFELLNAFNAFGEVQHQEKFQASEKRLFPEEILSLKEKTREDISKLFEDPSEDSEDILDNFIDISLSKETPSILV